MPHKVPPPLPIVDGVELRLVEEFLGYAAGDDGSIWGCRACGYGKSRFRDWRKLRTKRCGDDYCLISFRRNGKTVAMNVHRVVLLVFRGACPPSMEGCHENGIRTDNRLSNLRWDTPEHNHADKHKHGTVRVGEKHWNAKLTAAMVSKIRHLYRSKKCTTRELGKKFGVCHFNIYPIVHRKTWAHVP